MKSVGELSTEMKENELELGKYEEKKILRVKIQQLLTMDFLVNIEVTVKNLQS